MNPDTPYKGLSSFADSQLDASLFFGRGRERDTIVANVLASRLTVLYGPSGVGKSSLLAAGVAQSLRGGGSGGAVVVHGVWAGSPLESLIESIRAEVPTLGPIAGLEDAVAAAAQTRGEVHLLLDQFEECFRYPEAATIVAELPTLLNRTGLRLSILLALRDDALANLDSFTGQLPDAFGNLLRLDALNPHAGREAIVRPLERYGELTGGQYSAEPAFVDALLAQVGDEEQVATPFLQLVLERTWEAEQVDGSNTLHLDTLVQLGGASVIVETHVHGSLDALTAEHQEVAARVIRQLVTPSGAKLSHVESDLAALSGVNVQSLQPLVTSLERSRILRAQDATGGGRRIEIFHDVLGEPLLGWQQGYEVEHERRIARRERHRLWAIVFAIAAALIVVAALAVFAFTQRSTARSEAVRAHAHELDARALAELATNPASSLRTALVAAKLAPDAAAESALRAGLLTLREQRVFRPGGTGLSASFSPTGETLLEVGTGGAFLRFSAGRTVTLTKAGATAGAWSADGGELAVGDSSGVVRLFSPTGNLLRIVNTPAPIVTISFAGRVLVAGSGGHVRFIHGKAGSIRTVSFPGAVVAAAAAPNGHFVAVAARRSGRITTYVIDVATRRIRTTLPERGVDALAMSPNGRQLATASTDRTARVWQLPSGKLLHVLPQRGHVVAVRFSPRGRLLLSSSADGTAALWDVRRGTRVLLLVGATGGAVDAALSPDGTKIVVAFADDNARLYDATDGRLLAVFAGHTTPVNTVSFDKLGRTVATASDDGTVRLWSTTGGDELVPVDERSQPVDARFISNTVIQTRAGDLVRYVSLTGKLLRKVVARTSVGSSSPAKSPNGRLEAAIHGREVFLRDTRTKRTVRTLVGNQSLVEDAEFSPNGRLIVTGGADHLARIYSVDTGALLRVLRGHFFAVRTAEFSPDSRWIVTSSQFTAGLWDAANGQLLQYLRGHSKPLTGASFSPDGRYIVTGGDDGVASIVRCEICASLPGLEATARQRLAAIGGLSPS